jgi:thiol:disulfide interchange protein
MRTTFVLAALLAALTLHAAPEYPNRGPDIYDSRADGSLLIDTALRQASAAHKRVLLDFGANWCSWCHALHRLFTTDAEVRRRLAADYVVVMIDVNQRHGPARNAAVNEKYGNPIKEGLPVLVVLDPDGRQLVTQETGALEQAGAGEAHDPAKVIAFLKHWAPPPAAAGP